MRRLYLRIYAAVLAPHQVHESLARQHSARPLGERHQERELVRG